MNAFTRSLHPEIEAAQYVPCWTGSSWRNYDFTPPPLLPDCSALAVRRKGRPSMAEMCAWLTQEPRSVQTAARELGISRSSASNLLWRLEREGRARKVIKPAGYRRPLQVLYARVK